MFIGGGDVPEPNRVKGGLLGADYKIENGRYRFARVYNGENWNPELRAPLTQPGVDVKAGDYLLEVEGREVRPPAEVYSFFENTAGKQIKIKVGPDADGKDAREVTVVPLASEFPLRNRAWEEDNRRKVDELSGGKMAYVHVPDTAVGGYFNFNRFYFAQVGKQGAIIDERYNHGGEVADYIIDILKRPLRNCAIPREGEKLLLATGANLRTKNNGYQRNVRLGWRCAAVDVQAGQSWAAGRHTHVGWPGRNLRIIRLLLMVAASPRRAWQSTACMANGKWRTTESRRISKWKTILRQLRRGTTRQLEKAVEVTLETLKKNPVVIPEHPPYPNYHKK